MESAEGQSTPETLAVRRLYLYLVALATLVMASIGLGRVVHVILVEGYEALVSLPVLLPAESGLWRPAMREGLALALVAVPVWAYHWLHAARGDFGSTLRWVYLYGFSVLSGAVTVMVATGIIINGTLTWLLGISTEETAGSHFRFLPGAVVTLSVGFGLWGYHWMVARSEADDPAHEDQAARRVYAYIMSALGLAAWRWRWPRGCTRPSPFSPKALEASWRAETRGASPSPCSSHWPSWARRCGATTGLRFSVR